MKIIIKNEIGPRCIIKEDGQKIYDKIHKPLKKGDIVEVTYTEALAISLEPAR